MKNFIVTTKNGETLYKIPIQAQSEAKAREIVLTAIRKDSHARIGRGQPESMEQIVSCIKKTEK